MNRSRPKFGSLHIGQWSRYRYNKKAEEERIMNQKHQSDIKLLEDKLSNCLEINKRNTKEITSYQKSNKELKNEQLGLMEELNSLKIKIKRMKEADNELQNMKSVLNQKDSEMEILIKNIKEYKEKELEIKHYNERDDTLDSPFSSFHNVFDQKWIIKARIIEKGDVVKIEPYGRTLSIKLMDNSGEITVTILDKEAEILNDLTLLGNEYFISNHVVKGAKIISSLCNWSYKMTFNSK